MTRIMRELYSYSVSQAYSKMESVANMSPEAINLLEAQKAIIGFVRGYQDAIYDLHLFEQITGQKADTAAISKLRAVSTRAAESLRDLEASPRANRLRHQIPSEQVDSFFQY
jgi:hypothetical protein